MHFRFVGLLLISSVALAAGTTDSHYVIQKQFTLGGPGGWDYLTVDSATNRLFISRSDRVLVVKLVAAQFGAP
jgi:hypothetical protein